MRQTRGLNRSWSSSSATLALLLLAGCHSAGKHFHRAELNHPPVPGKAAALGRDEIVSECAHEPYSNASSGLIVSEPGLHEDVFALRDRDSLVPTAYNLSEALRLKALLDTEAASTAYPAHQADCIRQFADHFGTLTNTIVQADKVQHEINLTVFKQAGKESEEEQEHIDETQHELEQPSAPISH